jgi:hypothetical protein
LPAWKEIEREVPELATRVRELLDARRHKTIATLRRDGAPRISGIEAFFVESELWFGSMPAAVKAHDLQRDPRFALHGGSDDPPEWTADAKVAGRAGEIIDPARIRAVMAAAGSGEGGGDQEPGPEAEQAPSRMHLFRADIDEVVLTRLNEARDGLVIESWRPERGLRRIKR